MKPSGIDPATFQFVAECLNHCTTMCPHLPALGGGIEVGNTRCKKGLKMIFFDKSNESIVTKPWLLLICKFLCCVEVP
jgi:hypothetical protein